MDSANVLGGSMYKNMKLLQRALLLLIAVDLACGRRRETTFAEREVSNELASAARRAAAEHGDLTLESVVPEPWERVYVFPAYGWPDYVNSKLGFSWPTGRRSKTRVQDRYQLVVFTQSTRVVAWADFDTVYGRFDIAGDFLLRRDAILRFSTANGENLIAKKGTLPSIRRFNRPLPTAELP
jgi:hypothetical protein